MEMMTTPRKLMSRSPAPIAAADCKVVQARRHKKKMGRA